ncbi:hypothetical protein P7C73_g2649, partial [Tremellales sp. Uapishka_1]
MSCLTAIPVSPLLLAKAITLSFLNPFRRAQAENASGAITIHVKWGRDKSVSVYHTLLAILNPNPDALLPRFNVPIPSPSLTPLSKLLATLSAQTALPISSLKLIFKGAVLKDANLTLAAYGITDGATLVLVGKGGEVPGAAVPAGVKKKNKQPETTTESVLVDWIHALVTTLVDPLQASIDNFVAGSNAGQGQGESFAALQKEHARLSELLLRGLLDLDGVEIPSGWTDARKERKDGVRKVQGELTKVDEAWGERNKLGG